MLQIMTSILNTGEKDFNYVKEEKKLILLHNSFILGGPALSTLHVEFKTLQNEDVC